MYLFLIFGLVQLCGSQLQINVRNQGGEILQETIVANVSSNVVTLEYQNSDGTLITQFTDFKREVQILKALVLGEEERGQSQYQVMCFVTRFPKDDFISSDAMSKLRQKNPSAIRVAEMNRGVTNETLGVSLFVPKTGLISAHIAPMCTEALDSTYTSYADIESWSTLTGIPMTRLMSMVKYYRKPRDETVCADVTNVWSPCVCRLELHVPWYPCGLKFCKGSTPEAYRCGIKTCRRAYRFSYFVTYKQQCLWDE